MKKLFIFFTIFLILQNTCYSQTNLSFIYINGSNNNDEKMKNWFYNGIKKFHPTLKSYIEKDKYTAKHFLNDGEYVIDDNPNIFFWGDKSQNDLMFMKEKAYLLRSISPLIAFAVRNTIADMMHDAIWVQKDHNMIPIVQELDEKIKEQVKQNKKVVLFGYSAGTFITMEYVFTKAPYINLQDYFSKHIKNKDLEDFVKKNPKKDTCLMAFVASKITNTTPLGKITVNTHEKEFKEEYLNIDYYTDLYCIPQGSVIGVVNYASPIPLFYSDMADKNLDVNQFNSFMYKYLIEHDFFFLTVNYADDPLGFPNGVNFTNKEIKEGINSDFKKEHGFLYDYSRTLSFRTFMFAHTSYWNTKKRFSKAIVKGYTEGHKFQYDKEFQQKVLKSRKGLFNIYN